VYILCIMSQTEAGMMNDYLKRKRIFENNQLRGSIGPIIFPEDLANINVDDLVLVDRSDDRDVREFVKKYFKKMEDTLNFWGLDFDNLHEGLEEINLDTYPGRIMYIYKKILNNDELFYLFFDKLIEMKKILNDYGRHGIQMLISRPVEPVIRRNQREIRRDEYIIPDTLESFDMPVFNQEINIDKNEVGFEPIEGEKKIIEHMEENPENIVFVIKTKESGNKYFLTNKTVLEQLISSKENIQYECKTYGPYVRYVSETDIEHDKPIFKTTSFGSPIPYVYLDEIKFILENNYQIYVFSDEPHFTISAVASDSVINSTNIVNSDHCQYNEWDKPRPIYSISYVDSNVYLTSSNKKQKTGGRKTRRKTKNIKKRTRKYKRKNKK